MFAGINMFWALLRLIWLKWALRRARNIFLPKNINTIIIIITLEGIEKINTEKMTTKHSGEKFFWPALWENVNKLWNGLSILIGCIDRAIIWFSLFIGLFQWAKIHFSPPNSSFEPVKCTTMPDKVIIIFVFTSMFSSCLQGRQYPTAFPAIQPGVSSFDSNAEQRLQWR